MRSIREERGASLVEFAIVMPLLMLMVMGLAEFGLAFKDHLSISSASREGARVGAAAGRDASVDWFILRNVETALAGAVDRGSIVSVTVRNATPGGGGEQTSYRPSLDKCGWNPCPDPANPGLYVVPSWNPSGRRVEASGAGPDLLAVDVTVRHQWVTGFLPGLTGTRDFTDTTIMRLEPQIFDN